MQHHSKVKLVLFSLLLVTFALPSLARDISNEQRAASEARDRYNDATSNEAKLSKQVAEQEKRIAEDQSRLKELQDKLATNKSEAENAKADMDAKVEALERAWPDRNK
ncbi:MAG: hypothetical protein WBP13_07470 [Methylophilaceae bacterium]